MNALADGRWVTPERIRNYSRILLALSVLVYGGLLATAQGINDYRHRPLGTDFANVYAAGSYVREGRPAAPFSPRLQELREQEIFGPDTQFYGWHYPPYFLLLAGLLALLPYLAALALWQGLSGWLYLKTIHAILPQRKAWLPALAYPAVFVNLGHGHNGFLTAALIGGGLVLLPRRPWLAGMCFGALIYKPQFGLLIPVALLAGKHWRALVAAVSTVVALSAGVTWLYGRGIWQAFIDALPFTRQVVLEQGGTGFYKMQSLFAWVRLWGGGVGFAYAAQLIGIGVAAVLMAWVWRRRVADELKYATLILGCFLATPYSLDYDLMAIAPAMAFLVRHGVREGFAPYEKSLLAFAFLAPLFTRTVAQHALIPIGTIAVAALFAIAVRRGLKPWLPAVPRA